MEKGKMMRARISITFIFLLVGMLVFASDVKLGRADGIVYIRADGSIDPPTAPIQRNGEVYTLTGNITSGSDGIVVERNNIVIDGTGFTIESTTYLAHGIYLDGRSNVTIRNTSIKNFFDGICLNSSSNNSINGNTVANSGNDGIWLGNSSNNSIDRNVIMNSSWYGVALELSSKNNMRGNTIAHNGCGIELANSPNNTICHNNFNNTVQVLNGMTPELTNFWDNGCEGNYWSNYNGTDQDNDTVGDTFLPWEGVDNCPLMKVYWSYRDINHDLRVDMKDVGILGKAFGSSPGNKAWNPHADITGRERLIADGRVDMRDVGLVAQYFPDQLPFVGSKDSHVYHYQSCSYTREISAENQINFSSSEDARNQGYRPCLRCTPP
jgi:parallel beta-helix repeat protein